MIIHELNESDCLALVERAPFARLGCAFIGQPYIVPIQLALDADARCLYGFSLAGQKIAWMRRNPKVCVAVDEVADKDHWSSVVVTGRYQEVGAQTAPGPRRRAETLLQRRREWWLPGAAETSAAILGDPVFFRIVIASISGRRASRSTPASAS
jgi:nitroimidazol reductase NimA-like FMN-containing flavoprotein (pyridoxamine 5'-phosphate oxidase superfamily)